MKIQSWDGCFIRSILISAALALALTGCGGGGGGTDTGTGTVTGTTSFTVGGLVTGLTGSVVLQDNGGDDLTVTNGTFTFATKLVNGSTYKVTVPNQPTPQTCSVSSGAGTISGSNISVLVVCSATTYTVGGTVTVLNGSAVLQVNDDGDLPVTKGDFTFTTRVAKGSPYNVTLLSLQFPNQACTITGGDSGTGSGILSGDVTNVAVECVKNTTPRFAYVANRDSGDVSAYTINSTSGVLAPISCNSSCSGSNFLAGNNPYSVTVDPSGKFAYVANNSSDDVSAYTITSTGALAPNGTTLAGSKPSSVSVDPTGKFVYVTNWGDTVTSSTVSAYTITSTGALAPNGSALAGSQPNSVTVDPSGQFAYVANFSSNDISAYAIDSTGALSPINCSGTCNGINFPAGAGPGSVTVDPTGKFVYVANWGSGDVSAYTIDPGTGTAGALTQIPCGGGNGCNVDNFLAGSLPNSVIVDPSGQFAYVANWGSGDVSAYKIDSTTGALTAVGSSQVLAGGGPFSITVDPSGKFAYVANQTTDDVSAYTIDSITGALTPIICSGTCSSAYNFPAGTSPVSVTTTP